MNEQDQQWVRRLNQLSKPFNEGKLKTKCFHSKFYQTFLKEELTPNFFKFMQKIEEEETCPDSFDEKSKYPDIKAS